MQELRWWLLCHGLKVLTFMEESRFNKQVAVYATYCKENRKAIFRIAEAKAKQEKIVDVDGSYLYLKQQKLVSSGVSVAPVSHSTSPILGWETVNAANYKEYSSKILIVTQGLLILHIL